MRLIDADAFRRELDKHYPFTKEEQSKHGIADIAKSVLLSILMGMPTIEERKKGKWIEKHHAYFNEEKAIEEWQSCQCSVCGRYDTKPYMYFFDEPHFCSWCGADMRGEGNGNE